VSECDCIVEPFLFLDYVKNGIKKHLSLTDLVVIDAEFSMKDYGLILRNYDRERLKSLDATKTEPQIKLNL
jgi:hypothetical protein